MTKNITVFGGSGFLGSHTADALSDAGYRVRIFDRVESPWVRPDQEMIVGDLLDRDAVFDAINGSNAVYHFAGIADIGDAAEDPYRTAEINVLVTRFTAALAFCGSSAMAWLKESIASS